MQNDRTFFGYIFVIYLHIIETSIDLIIGF